MDRGTIGEALGMCCSRRMDIEELKNVLDKHRGETFQHTFYRIFDDPGFKREETLTDESITYFLDKAADRKITWNECYGEPYNVISIDAQGNVETINILLYNNTNRKRSCQ